MRYHDAVVDAEPLVGCKYAAASIPRHDSHHLLQALIRANSPDNKHLLAPYMCHGPLRNLHQHCINRLLQREAQILSSHKLPALRLQPLLVGQAFVQTLGQDIGGRQYAREARIHALDRIRQLHKVPPLLRQLLNVVAGKGVVWNQERARETINAVPNRNVERLAEDAVAVRRVGNDLGVAAAHVEHHGVLGARDGAPHFDVTDAVVYADERLVPEEGAGAGGEGDGLERGAHAGAFGVAYAVEVGDFDAGLADGLFDEADDPGAVVEGRLFREETLARWGIVGVSEVCEDDGRLGR